MKGVWINGPDGPVGLTPLTAGADLTAGQGVRLDVQGTVLPSSEALVHTPAQTPTPDAAIKRAALRWGEAGFIRGGQA